MLAGSDDFGNAAWLVVVTVVIWLVVVERDLASVLIGVTRTRPAKKTTTELGIVSNGSAIQIRIPVEGTVQTVHGTMPATKALRNLPPEASSSLIGSAGAYNSTAGQIQWGK